MSKIRIICLCILFLGVNKIYTQVPTLDWAGKIGKNGSDYGYQVHAGLDGNIYAVGTFKGNNVDFNIDTAAAEVDVFSSGNYNGSILVKYTKTGEFLGGFSLHSDNDMVINGTVTFNSIYVESDGEIYVTGFYQGTTDFDPGVGENILTAIGDADIFIAKYSGDFTLQWVKRIGYAGRLSGGEKLVLGNDGAIYVTGYFGGVCDFNPDDIAVNNLTSLGTDDAFIAKYSNSGDYIFALGIGGTSTDRGYGICVTNDNTIFATGKFSQSADLNPDLTEENIYATGGSLSGTYMASYSSTGEFLWAHELDVPWYGSGRSVVTDNTGNVYFAGTFLGEVDFNMDDVASNPDTTLGYVGYLVKYLYDGTYVWHALVEGTAVVDCYDVSLDKLGGVNICGFHAGETDFNYASGAAYVLTADGTNNFVANYSTSGVFKWAFQIYGTTSGVAYCSTNDNVGDLYVTGWIKGTGDFNPDPGITDTIVWSGGEGDFFLAKYITDKQPQSITDFSKNSVLHVYPNPATNVVFIDIDAENMTASHGILSLTNMNGQLIQYQNWNGGLHNDMNLPADLPSGLYLLQLTTSGENFYNVIVH